VDTTERANSARNAGIAGIAYLSAVSGAGTLRRDS
jgi:hypothetical protein